FWSHAPSVARVDLRVVAACHQHIGMHHAAAENFKPARVLTDLATLAAAHKTFHIHFGGWFREREVRSAETQTSAFTEHAAHKIRDRSLQIREGDVLANGESFHLIELHFRP